MGVLAILNGQRREPVLPHAGAVFHQRPAYIAAAGLPGPRKIGDRVADIRGRLEKIARIAGEAQHGGRARQYLHQPDFAGGAARVGVVAAFDHRDRIGQRRRHALANRLRHHLLDI
jgi:hypothetical protein